MRGEKSSGDQLRVRVRCLDQRRQAAVAASEVEKPIDAIRQPFEKRAFTFGAMRDLVGARQILERMVGGSPQVRRLVTLQTLSVRELERAL